MAQGSDSTVLGSFIGLLTVGEMLGAFTIAKALGTMRERFALFVCSLVFFLCLALTLACCWTPGLINNRIQLYVAATLLGLSNAWRSSIFDVLIIRECTNTTAALEIRRLVRYSMISAVIGPSLSGIFLTWQNSDLAMGLALCVLMTPVLLLAPWNSSGHQERPDRLVAPLTVAGGTLLRGAALLARLRPMWMFLAISFFTQACLSLFFSFVLPAFTSKAGLPPWTMASFENIFSIFGFLVGGTIAARIFKDYKRHSIILFGTSIAACLMFFPGLLGVRFDTVELILVGGLLAALMGSSAVALDSIVNPLIYLTVPTSHQPEFIQCTAIAHRFVLLSTAWFVGYLMGHFSFSVICFGAGSLLTVVVLTGGLVRTIAPLTKLEDHEIPGAYGRMFPMFFGTDAEQ